VKAEKRSEEIWRKWRRKTSGRKKKSENRRARKAAWQLKNDDQRSKMAA
jgi:hypothetical protein